MTCTWIVYRYHWSALVIVAFYYCVHHDHQMHYQDQQRGFYDHQTDLTFELHSQQLVRTLTLLGAGSDWTHWLHDKCQQTWLKSNLVHTSNVLSDIDHSHWTQLYHRLNYFPGPQTHPNSQIVAQIVYLALSLHQNRYCSNITFFLSLHNDPNLFKMVLQLKKHHEVFYMGPNVNETDRNCADKSFYRSIQGK